jgi:hypothetical protein
LDRLFFTLQLAIKKHRTVEFLAKPEQKVEELDPKTHWLLASPPMQGWN